MTLADLKFSALKFPARVGVASLLCLFAGSHLVSVTFVLSAADASAVERPFELVAYIRNRRRIGAASPRLEVCEIARFSWTNGCEVIASNRRGIVEELPIAANDALADLQPHVGNTQSIGCYKPVQTRRDHE